MPRFTLCAAIPVRSRADQPRCPDQPSARAARSGRPSVLRPARYRAPWPCGRKPDDISRFPERYFDCCWSER
jgi:hypothetical protein